MRKINEIRKRQRKIDELNAIYFKLADARLIASIDDEVEDSIQKVMDDVYHKMTVLSDEMDEL